MPAASATCWPPRFSGYPPARDSIAALPSSRRPYGPKRSVQLLACTSPHPRNYAPAGASRRFATRHEPTAGWLVAFAASGRLCGGRRCAPRPSRCAPSVLCNRTAPDHRTVRSCTTRSALVITGRGLRTPAGRSTWQPVHVALSSRRQSSCPSGSQGPQSYRFRRKFHRLGGTFCVCA